MRSTGRVFVGDRLSGYVDVYGARGNSRRSSAQGRSKPAGIAVDESSGDVYVAEPLASGAGV